MGEMGSRLKQIRKAAGLSQADLADLAGLSKDSIGRYERNERDIRMNDLQKIAVALRVPVGDLSPCVFGVDTPLNGRVASPKPIQAPLLPGKIKQIRMVPVLTPSVVERANPDGPGEIDLRDVERIALVLAQEFAHVPVDELGVYVMEDDAMARCDLPEGAMAVVWVGQPVPDGDVGLLWVRGRLLVRGVVPRKSGAVDLMAGDGSAFTVPAEETTDPDWFRVLGLVVGRSGFSKIRRSW